MSVSSSIDIQTTSSDRSIALFSIKALKEFGWMLNHNGAVFYLPLEDDDEFNWTSANMSDTDLNNILIQKDRLGELIGIAMTWHNTDIGGEFLFRASGLISINLSINRKLTGSNLTDVNWYLEKIIPALHRGNIQIESISFSEHA